MRLMTTVSRPLVVSRRQAGLGLIEVLVTVLILSIGLLGLAALQATSLKASGDAQSMQMAVQHASDYLERMRGNRGSISAYSMSEEKPVCASSVTLGGDLVSDDKALWLNAIACNLPQVTATVTVFDTSVTIRISWMDRIGSRRDEIVEKQMEMSSEI